MSQLVRPDRGSTDTVVRRTVRALMGHYDVTSAQVAEAAGLSRSTFYLRMDGKPWSVDEIVQVAWALGVRGVDLIEGVRNMTELTEEPPVYELVRRQGLEPRTRCPRVLTVAAPRVPVLA